MREMESSKNRWGPVLFFSPFLSLWNTCSHTLHLTELHVPWDDCESSFKSKCVYLCVLEKEGEVCTWHTERVFWCLGKMAHWVCVCVLYPVCVTFVKCAWVPIKVLTFCVCACVCVNLINDWHGSPTALVMCLDQCYKQGVKGLPRHQPFKWPASCSGRWMEMLGY